MMRTFTSLLVLAGCTFVSAQTTGKLGDAAVITNNPNSTKYIATFAKKTNGSFGGTLVAESHSNGTGVDFILKVQGLPFVGGPFSYHLHDQPVPADGNCTSTLAHLDPYQRGQDPVCDASKPATCEVGDLSGKHGKLNGTEAEKSFTDLYAALVPGIGAFFGNRSVVVHYANSTRLACANFTLVDDTY